MGELDTPVEDVMRYIMRIPKSQGSHSKLRAQRKLPKGCELGDSEGREERAS